MRRIGLFLAAWLVGATVGCADFTPPLTPPARGGSAWTELSSEHLTLVTDLNMYEARQLLVDFERGFRALLDNELAMAPADRHHVRVVVFARPIDVREFPEATADGFSPRKLAGDREAIPTLVISGSATAGTRSAFLHELTHHLVTREFSMRPVWFEEGLALFYSTLRVDDEAVYIGAAPVGLAVLHWRQSVDGIRSANNASTLTRRGFVPPRATSYRNTRIPRASELLRLDRGAFYEHRSDSQFDQTWRPISKYAGAWALMHMFHHGPAAYRARYNTFTAALRSGQSTPEAWAASFGDLPENVLDRDFVAYLGKPGQPDENYRPVSDAPIPKERPLSNTEVHLLWAHLREHQPG